jgi:mono/diheme cytochrome c family protein
MVSRRKYYMKTKLLTLILIAGLISACGGQPTETPASLPTDKPVPASEVPASPTDTAVPPTETPTEEPTVAPTPETTAVSFASDIQPLLQSRCLNCHGGERLEEGLSMKTYEALLAGSDNGPVILPGDANGSLLAELILNKKMPKKGPKLTPPQTQLIIDWINQGALNN